jgi:hypothetical protein
MYSHHRHHYFGRFFISRFRRLSTSLVCILISFSHILQTLAFMSSYRSFSSRAAFLAFEASFFSYLSAPCKALTVSVDFRSSLSCRSSALVASTCFALAMRLEKEVRSKGFLFGAAAAFHCFPAVSLHGDFSHTGLAYP